MPENYLELLGKYREKDEKTPQGETIPEKQTLNNERLRDYLDKNNFTVDNFEQRFNLQTALSLLQTGGTKGELEMIKVIRDGQSYLAKIGQADLIEKTNEGAFKSTLEMELSNRKETDKEPLIMDSYHTYHTVRKLVEKSLKIQKRFTEQREQEKVSAEKGLKESFAGVIEDVKKNYSGMSSTEALAAVGVLVIGSIALLTSENDKVKKVKGGLWSLLKVGGLAVGGNYVYKLFTGKTALEAATDWSKSTVAKEGFWTETFKTDAEKAAILQKSTVYLANKDFLDLAKRYREAKASGQTEIKTTGVLENDMPPKDIYTALDVFFSRYPVEKMELKYRNSKVKPTWTTVVAAEMTEDGRLEYQGNPAERAIDNMKEFATKGANVFWAAATGGKALIKDLYHKIWDKDPTEAEANDGIAKIRKQLENQKDNESEVGAFLDEHMSATSAKQFNEMLTKGEWDKKEPHVKFMEVPGDSIYVMSESKLDASLASEKAVGDMIKNALKQAENVLKARYPEAADNINKFIDYNEMRGVRIASNSTFKLFMRMPVKGNPEYGRRSALVVPPGGREEKPGVEIFGPKDRIEYSRLEDWEKELFRIKFCLDAGQTAEIDKICRWYTNEYKTKNMDSKEVFNALFEDEKVRAKALEETQIKPGLRANIDLLTNNEKKLVEIEKDAAADFEGKEAFEPLQIYMRRNLGNKVRLAILGDDAARSYFIGLNDKRYNPAQNKDWMEDLIKDYKVRCKEFADNYSKGLIKIP